MLLLDDLINGGLSSYKIQLFHLSQEGGTVAASAMRLVHFYKVADCNKD